MASEEKRLKKPDWLKTRLTVTPDFSGVRGTLQNRRLHTVCQEAGAQPARMLGP
jgi:lipoic acid synthetase